MRRSSDTMAITTDVTELKNRWEQLGARIEEMKVYL